MWVGFGVAFLCGFVFAALVDDVRRGRIEPSPRAIGLSRVGNEWELEFSGGQRYRSEEGIVWYQFPSGQRCSLSWEMWLEREFERRRHIDKWLGEGL